MVSNIPTEEMNTESLALQRLYIPAANDGEDAGGQGDGNANLGNRVGLNSGESGRDTQVRNCDGGVVSNREDGQSEIGAQGRRIGGQDGDTDGQGVRDVGIREGKDLRNDDAEGVEPEDESGQEGSAKDSGVMNVSDHGAGANGPSNAA